MEKGIVKRRLGERSYEVETPDAVYRRNRVHLKKTYDASDTTDIDLPLPAQEVSPQPQVINGELSTTQPPPQPVPKTPASTTAKSPPKQGYQHQLDHQLKSGKQLNATFAFWLIS